MCDAQASEQDGYELFKSEEYDAQNSSQADIRLSQERHAVCYSCYDDCLDATPYRFADEYVGGPKDLEKLARNRIDISLLKVCHQIYVETNPILWGTTTWSFTHALAFSQFMNGRNANQRRFMKKLHLDLDPRYCWVKENWARGWHAALHQTVQSKFESLEMFALGHQG